MSVRAVLFDLDNTLTPRRACVEAFARVFVGDWGEALAPVDDGWLQEVFVAADQNGYNPRRAEELLERLVWREPPSVDAIEEHWQRRFPAATVTRDGVHELLSELRDRGVLLGCVTNGGVRGQQAKIDVLGLGGYFGATVISDAVGCKKPDARIFQVAVDALGVSAGETWFVGDHPINDVVGARHFGMEAVWVRTEAHAWPTGEAPPAHSIEDFGALRSLLAGSGSRGG